MAKYEAEELLHALAGDAAQEEGRAALDEAQLQAYREGKLDADEAARVELKLADSPEARAALRSLAGVDPSGDTAVPPAAVRESVLAQFDDKRPARPDPARVRRKRLLRTLLPAAVFVTLVFGMQLFNRPMRELPATEIDVSNASAVRSGPALTFEGNDRFTGLADDRLKIRVRPTRDAVPGVEYGLYRWRGDTIERIDDEQWVRREDANESSELLVEAAALVSAPAGDKVAWIVAAWRGELPDEIAVPPGSDERAVLDLLTDAGRRRAHPIAIEIVPP